MKTVRVRSLILAALFALALVGCAGEVGPTQSAIINVPKPDDPSQVWDVELNLGALIPLGTVITDDSTSEVSPAASGVKFGSYREPCAR